MRKRLLSILLSITLIVTMFPPFMGQQADAAGYYFIFPELSGDVNNPTQTNDMEINLEGTYNAVSESSIVYTVEQILDKDANPMRVGLKRENTTAGLAAAGGTISVVGLDLFPGLNRITFKGKSGFTELSDTFYVEYIDNPVIYDLKISGRAGEYEISENKMVVTQDMTTQDGVITILGKAPNAEEVTVHINGDFNKTFRVNNGQFIASGLRLEKGKNIVKLVVSNESQHVETTKELIYFNGDITFFDVELKTSTMAFDLEKNPTVPGLSGNQLLLSGKLVVPNYIDENGDPHPDPDNWTATDNVTVEIDGTGSAEYVIDANANMELSDDFYPSGTNPPDNAPFFVLEFNGIAIGSIASAEDLTDPAALQFKFDQLYRLAFRMHNYVKSAAYNQATEDRQSGFSFTLRDDTIRYVREVRYLTNYSSASDYGELTGVVLDETGYEVFKTPFELELVANQNIRNLTAANISIEAYESNGTKVSGTVEFEIVDINSEKNETEDAFHLPETNKIIRIKKLPKVGYQVLRITLDGQTTYYDQPITYVFGPYVSFDKLYNGMMVETPDDQSTSEIGINQLDFLGQLHNVDTSTIVASGSGQTIFLTINNRPVELELIYENGKFEGKFNVKDVEAAKKMLNTGKNTIIFTYQYLSEYYTRTIIINVVPTDYPEVPAEGTRGIYPTTHSNNDKDPERFIELSEGIYSTSEKKFNIYGTFRLLDLDSAGKIEKNQYRFEILKNGSTYIKWDLYDNIDANNNFKDNDNNARFDVTYVEDNVNGDYFSFVLEDETVPENTGSIVYTFIAYKETANTFYRLEIQSVDAPYIILRPFLPEQKVINQNYLDVVIYSENAESIVIDDFVGEKFDFDEDNDGDIDFPDAFKIRVENLRANRTNEIEFEITLQSGDVIEGSFEVYYAATNIQGAQYLTGMGNRIRTFNDAFELEFPRGTQLKNKVDPTDRETWEQTYANHKILIGIADPDNGVVDPMLYEDQPSGFQNQIKLSELEFNATLPARFIQASPMYWIDAGLADDPGTSEFDPVETGFLPFQLPRTGLPSYMDRDEERALVPTARGELTLKFDPYIVQSAGTNVTVFRYDPALRMWENIGGVVDTRNNTITVPFDQFGYYVVMKLQYSFVDITTHPYARDEMEAIYSKGVMNNMDDDNFGANNYITRGEFAAMIVKALRIPLNYDDKYENLHFDDVAPVIVPGALWDYRYIETAAREGIVVGIEPKRFDPYGELTREQAAVILARALELKMEVDREEVDEDLAKEFVDYASIDYYARPAVLAVLDKGLMVGSPVDPADPDSGMVFEPKDNLLRSEAAIMMTRVMASQKLLPKMN